MSDTMVDGVVWALWALSAEVDYAEWVDTHRANPTAALLQSIRDEFAVGEVEEIALRAPEGAAAALRELLAQRHTEGKVD